MRHLHLQVAPQARDVVKAYQLRYFVGKIEHVAVVHECGPPLAVERLERRLREMHKRKKVSAVTLSRFR